MVVSIHSSLADSVACSEIGSALSVIKKIQDGGHYHKIPSFTGLGTGTVVNTVAELDLLTPPATAERSVAAALRIWFTRRDFFFMCSIFSESSEPIGLKFGHDA